MPGTVRPDPSTLGVVGERGSDHEGRVSVRFRLAPEVESALAGFGPAHQELRLGQSLDRPLGLHCLLYLVPDRICKPETLHPQGSVADALSVSEHRLARVVGSAIKAFSWDPPKAPDNLHVFVPCRPTLAVLRKELEPRLLMAALLECRDLGLVELRGANGRSGRRHVRVVPVATPALDGLCGRITKRLEQKGEQGARKLFSGVIRSGPVISKATWAFDEVESELADHGYMRPVVMTLRWLARKKVQAFVDCEQIQNLAEDCTLAVDRWNRAWAADATMCKTLLRDCITALERTEGGG
jgi:hypothetical protein